MEVRHAEPKQLRTALTTINKKYDGNIQFNGGLSFNPSFIRFRLKCLDSKKLGHRRGFGLNGEKGKLMASACWHVHGHFFDALFKIEPKAVIRATTQKISVSEGNWEDRNIGSVMQPLYFSEACDCSEDGLE